MLNEYWIHTQYTINDLSRYLLPTQWNLAVDRQAKGRRRTQGKTSFMSKSKGATSHLPDSLTERMNHRPLFPMTPSFFDDIPVCQLHGQGSFAAAFLVLNKLLSGDLSKAKEQHLCRLSRKCFGCLAGEHITSRQPFTSSFCPTAEGTPHTLCLWGEQSLSSLLIHSHPLPLPLFYSCTF